ncbi:MAG: MurR/RpiR family transcriptional regulator, partial [Pseudomonadota bacterium]|nr:MurR/RpiR family transcriptional regulator [Pseudomonadota bacterium]
SVSYRRIAEFLLRNAMRATAWGIEELAESCEVSAATISRFARHLGFVSYAALRGEIARALQSALEPVEKLRNSIARREHAASPGSASLEYAIANLGATLQGLPYAEIDQVVHKLMDAGAVYIMGFGLSAHLAGILALHLQPFCAQVVEVVGYGGTEVAAGRLVNVSSKDVVVVISFPRYANDAINLAHFARERRACIVAITDSPVSPLATLANHTLLAQSTHPILPSSATAAITLIETLVASLMVSNKKNVAKAAKLTEAIASWLYGDAIALHRPRSKRGARQD